VLSELSIVWAEEEDRSLFGENILLNISIVGVSDNWRGKQTGLVDNPGYTMDNVAGKSLVTYCITILRKYCSGFTT
jgi:hypothetical protein